MKRLSAIALTLAMTAMPALLSAALDVGRSPAITPRIPSADRSAGNRVFLEHADLLDKAETDSFMVLMGNVEFTKGPMIMRCDSAHYYPDTESMDAFGHVSMEQGDTLFVFADELNYRGPEEIAYLYANPGQKVRMINRDVTLETDEFVYDLRAELGYYLVGGRLSDPHNTLVSQQGEYAPSTKEANFYIDVHLNSRDESDTLDIYTDTLYYNTESRIAELHAPSRIINQRGIIHTRDGLYDTQADTAVLYARSLVESNDQKTLTADTIYYRRDPGEGLAYGSAVVCDSTRHLEARGNYGYYNQSTDSTFMTGRAELRDCSGEDTLYVHGRYVISVRDIDTVRIEADTIRGIEASERIDTNYVARIFPRVRLFRRDVQGICDSMQFTTVDSTLRMYVHPILWNEEQQIFGKVIEMQMNDSTVRQARLPQSGFVASLIEGDYYNQISGKSMTADFEDGQMRRLYIDGNVEIIMYPEETDSTINKHVSAESSFMEAWFQGQTTERIKMWPETSGTVTPMFLVKRGQLFLSRFKWYDFLRPRNRDDIFVVTSGMDDLMLSPE